jgi:TolB protein
MTTTPFVHRSARFLLLAALTLPAALSLGGCAACPNAQCKADAEASAKQNKPLPDAWVQKGTTVPNTGRRVRPDLVNVFGEFGGIDRGDSRVVGEAGFQQHTALDEGEDWGVSVDHTGRWMLFSSTRHSESSDLYMQRVDGTAVTQLTSDPTEDAFPVFSPDGKQIAFCSTRSGSWQVYVMDVDGRNAIQVTTGRAQCIRPSFAPDGKRVVYSSLGPRSNQWELWTANLETGEQRMIGYGLFPSWSPRRDLDRIAYQRNRQRGSRWFTLWTIDLIEGEGRRPTEVAVSPVAAIVTPCWSPDGKRLAFSTVVEPGMTGATTDGVSLREPVKQPLLPKRGRQDVWTVDADGGNRQRLTDGVGSNLMPFWSADGRVYFISDRDGHECVWSVRADGKARTFTADTKDRDTY